MVEEVAIKTGKSEDDVVNEFINTKAVELRTSTKTAKEATRSYENDENTKRRF